MTYLTYDDLAERWGITPEAVRLRKYRGKLPEPDRMFGKSPAWLTETIEALEDKHGQMANDG